MLVAALQPPFAGIAAIVCVCSVRACTNEHGCLVSSTHLPQKQRVAAEVLDGRDQERLECARRSAAETPKFWLHRVARDDVRFVVEGPSLVSAPVRSFGNNKQAMAPSWDICIRRT